MFILGHTPSFFMLLCLPSFLGSLVLARTLSGTRLDSTLSWYSPGPFSILARILPFFGTRLDPFPVLVQILPFFRYEPEHFPGTSLNTFPVLARILPFSSTRPDPFRYSPEFYLFLVLTQTLSWYSPWFYPFPVLAQTLFRYLPKHFSCTGLDHFSGTHLDPFRYSPGYDLFLVLTRTLPFSSTCPDTILFVLHSSVLAQIWSIFRYSPRFYPFLVLVRTLFWYSPDFYPSLVLTRIRSFLSCILWYSLGYDLFYDTRLDSTLSRYSPIPFSGTHPDSTSFRYLPRCDLFSGTRSEPFQYSHRYDLFSDIVLGFPWVLWYSPGLDPFSFSLFQHHVRISWSFPISCLVFFSLLWHHV